MFGTRHGSIEPDLEPIWIRVSQARIGYGLNWNRFIPTQVGCKRLCSVMGSIEPCLGPIWIRLSQARIGSELSWIHSIPIHVGCKRVGVRYGFDWARSGSVMDPNESGTDRIWIELAPFHSNTGQMQTFGIRHGSIEPDLDPIWIRLSQARNGYGLHWSQPIPIQVGCKRLGSDMGSNGPCLDPMWIRLSQARSGSVLNWAPAQANPGRMQTFGIRHGSVEPDLNPIWIRLSQARAR